ncbi:hypothetical protein TL16_g05352 [Triparma laevis f. inornata]|uniref:Uncharacterized protein n=2 Tax=Triparma laevis TaxID=1534972 RepID=A0A9W7CCS1_9STRA|nr:hypothetical protein TL16_g05352 [Triparma laevis f. inornata]GMI03801.1 hypothetical protein TrLO_g11009 [Triparma laevis f. longispina]
MTPPESNQSIIHDSPTYLNTPPSACALNHYIVTEVFNVPYDSCTSDCVGSTVTDVLIALHACYMSVKIFKSRPKFNGLSFIISSYVLINSIWSLEGSLFWLQPGGRRLPEPFNVDYFDVMWKLNGGFEAILLVLFWNLAFRLLEVSRCLPSVLSKYKKAFRMFTFLHGISFSLLCIYDCNFNNFVLFGASNIVLPLTSCWISLIVVMCTYWPHLTRDAGERIKKYRATGSARLIRVHPIVLGVISGSAYWVGNTGIYFGKDVLLTLWTRNVLSFLIGRNVSSNEWEEMALFHMGTLIGNEMLFRCWIWVAAAEAEVKDERGKDWKENEEKPRVWLRDVILNNKTKKEN